MEMAPAAYQEAAAAPHNVWMDALVAVGNTATAPPLQKEERNNKKTEADCLQLSSVGANTTFCG